MQEVERLLGEASVMRVETHMCRFGMCSVDAAGRSLVLKPTYFMTNSAHIAAELNRLCDNKVAGTQHRHVQLMNGRASAAQVYPEALCRAICRGLKHQKEATTTKKYLLNAVDCNQTVSSVGELPPEEPGAETWEEFWDSASGQLLEPTAVRKARREEIEYIRQSNLYQIVPIKDCVRKTGRKPIAGRWVDQNKGDAQAPLYRSRYVAKEFKRGNNPELFAATPPLEALRALVSAVATGDGSKNAEDERVMMTMDVSRAFFYAPATRDVYVELPDEEGLDKTKFCAKLNYSLYGTRDAPMNWAETYSKHLLEIGFVSGKSSPCVFWHPSKDLKVLVHGDDYVCVGARRHIRWLEEQVRKRFKIKSEVLGLGPGEKREIRILNRIIRISTQGLEYEADPRHQEIILNELGLDNAKGVSVTGTKDAPKQPGGEQLLTGSRATHYRAVTARINFLAQDRPDLLFAAKECSRSMSSPTEQDFEKLKRLGRYLVSQPRVVVHYPWQSAVALRDQTGGSSRVVGYSDSDWAGCKETRRSTSGGSIMVGGHWIKSWSRTQAVTALSSGEAELYAMVKTSAETIGMLSLLRDWGLAAGGDVMGDASACLGIIQRKGLGKLRHIQTNYLWVQEKAATKELLYGKVPGVDNMADLMTKYLGKAETVKHLGSMGAYLVQGRAESAPQLVSSFVRVYRPDFAAGCRLLPVASPRHRRQCTECRSSLCSRLVRGGVTKVAVHCT